MHSPVANRRLSACATHVANLRFSAYITQVGRPSQHL